MTSYRESDIVYVNQKNFKAKEKVKASNVLLKKEKYSQIFNLQQSKNEQLLFKLVAVNNVEGVKQLLDKGINVNSQDPLRRTALHMATSRSYTEMVKLLLDYKADPNLQDILLNTPLHLAACNNNIALIKLLIDAGANLKLLNLNQKNPIEIAEGKLRIIMSQYSKNSKEIVTIQNEIREIVEMMISMWTNKETSRWGHHRNNIEDLELIKHSLEISETENIECQLGQLLTELEMFSI